VHRFCEEQGVTVRNSYSLSSSYNEAIRKIRCALFGYSWLWRVYTRKE